MDRVRAGVPRWKIGGGNPLSVETREETREQMLRGGVAVLADDDRVASRHLEMYLKKVGSRD